jgi:hypothetical protein
MIGFAHPITAINEDLGRHLLLGKIIVQTHSIPTTNLLSYTYPDFPFVNSHWLAEVVFYLVFNLSGFTGLYFLTLLTVAGTCSLLYHYTAKRYPGFAPIVAAGMVINILLQRTDIRPELFSFLFLSAFLTILYRYRVKVSNAIFWLIPLEIVWVNMHIYFLIGILLIGLFFLDSLVLNTYKVKTARGKLGLVLLLALSAACINPQGIAGLLYPFTVYSKFGMPVLETQSIFSIQHLFSYSGIRYVELCMLAVTALMVLNKKNTRPIDWLILITFSALAISAIRNFPLFAYAIFIPLVSALADVGKSVKKFILAHRNLLAVTHEHMLKMYCVSLCFLLILIEIYKVVSIQSVGAQTKEFAKPSVDFFVKEELHGPIFNNFDIGSYLTYRLYPKEKVFVDGRVDAYPREFLQTENFNSFDKKYHFNVLFLSHWDQTPAKNVLLTQLMKNPGYRLVYLDDYAMIFMKNTQKNENIIKKYGITERTYLLPENRDKESLIRYLYMFEKIGWKKQKEAVVKQLHE